mgnify:CR=1 FL=1
MKKICFVIFFYFISSFFIIEYQFSQTRFIPGRKIKYSIQNEVYIKRNFKYGTIYNIHSKKLKKVLIGGWDILPGQVIIFNKNSRFTVYNLKNDANILNKGRWKTKYNTILFKLDYSNTWIKADIKKILFIKRKSTSRFKYFVYIVFKKNIFLGKGISMNFN